MRANVTADPRRLALTGWALVVLVAILMLVIRGREEAGPAVVFAVVAVAVGAWIWLRGSRPAWIVSLVLGALWLLQFVAYTIADLVSDDFSGSIFIIDLIAVVAGLAVIAGCVSGLRRRNAAAEPST
jgi:uncharacterized membrane protein